MLWGYNSVFEANEENASLYIFRINKFSFFYKIDIRYKLIINIPISYTSQIDAYKET